MRVLLLSESKEQFIELLRSSNRNGIENLINYLSDETDFFTAPASTKFHGAYAGGLVEHSLDVYHQLSGALTIAYIKSMDYAEIPASSIYIVSLLHDVCKANFYKIEMRNKKNEKGVWEQVPVYTIDDQLPFGHGEKSVMIINKYIRLSDEEIAAINWHMGGFDSRAKDYSGSMALSNAMGKWPLVTLLHMADLAATYFTNER